jgi:hypothetical protein
MTEISTPQEAQKPPDSKPNKELIYSSDFTSSSTSLSLSTLSSFALWAPLDIGERFLKMQGLKSPLFCGLCSLYLFSLHKLCFHWTGKCSHVGSASKIKLKMLK